MSKRQQTLLSFNFKKAKVGENEGTSNQIDMRTSKTDRSDRNDDPTCSKFLEKGMNTNNSSIGNSKKNCVDIGMCSELEELSDTEKIAILKSKNTIEDFEYPFSIHNKKGKDVKCYLSRKHLEAFQWLTYSHARKGLFCKFCVLFAQPGGVYKQS